MIEDNIRTYLLSQSPISTLVGTDAAGSMARIYSMDRQQNITADSIVYERTGTQHAHMLSGAAGFATAFLSFDCIATTYARAKALAEALRGELQGYSGTMGDATIYSVILQDESDDFDPPADGTQKGQYHVTQEYSFLFTESVPSFA
jgi:hypothetical protein